MCLLCLRSFPDKKILVENNACHSSLFVTIVIGWAGRMLYAVGLYILAQPNFRQSSLPASTLHHPDSTRPGQL